VARDQGDALAVTPRTLHKRLSEKGLLVTREEGRGYLTVRRTLGGSRKSVLHLHAGTLVPQEVAQTAQTAHGTHENEPDQEGGSPNGDAEWASSWASSATGDLEVAQELAQSAPADQERPGGNGLFGLVGLVPETEGALTDAQF
jgi:hypothetical protein